jgi:hypothetical protein
VACSGYHQPTVRTGYEEIIPQRTTDLYCVTAKQDGVVTSVSGHGVVVTYVDGTRTGYETGRKFGKAAGLVIPHEIVSPLKEGDKLAVGDVIIYNEGFFEADFFNPKKVIWKNSVNVKTVFWESTDTLEDASAISPKVSALLGTRITKVKTLQLAFDSSVKSLIAKGTQVEYDTQLCILQDAVSANAGQFDEETMDSLSILSTQTPRAGVKGIVERIEVYYHGDIEDMSPSLQAIVSQSNKEMSSKAKALGKTVYTGKVDAGFRIEGNPLGLDQIAIQIYITTDVGAGIGDKGVFANQLKTVFSSSMEGSYKTEIGEEVDAIFGYQSVDARIVNSPYLIGSANLVLEALAEKMVEAYEG